MHSFSLLILAFVPAQDPAADLRAAQYELRFSRDLPQLVSDARALSWQSLLPRLYRYSLRAPLAAEVKLDPRYAQADRGFVPRSQPALEQLALGLSADPPRPEYPQLAAGARGSGDSLSPTEVFQLPPLSRGAEPMLTLLGDPASLATRPYTAPLLTASRGPAPPRSDVRVPDPFVIQREAALPTIGPDLDPPAVSLGAPTRPELPIAPATK